MDTENKPPLTDESRTLQEVCTCGNITEEYNHESICDLWWSWDFEHGEARWDPASQSLAIDADFANATAEDINQMTDEEFEALFNGAPTVSSQYDVDDSMWSTSTTATPVTTTAKSFTSYPYAAGAYNFVTKDRHYQQEVVLPGGTVVYASSHTRKREVDEPTPDLGIYLDGCWDPDTVAFSIGCPDYGVPIPAPWQVIHIAREGLRVARDGQRVEIGCVGGHGRTGMMLAIMAVVESEGKMTGPSAVKFIRNNYCERAVESAKQEWYVAGIRAELRGKKWPAEPPKPVYVSTFKPVVAGIPTVAPTQTTNTVTVTRETPTTVAPAPKTTLTVDIEEMSEAEWDHYASRYWETTETATTAPVLKVTNTLEIVRAALAKKAKKDGKHKGK